MPAGDGHELPSLSDDLRLIGDTGDGDPASAPKREESLVTKLAQGAKDRVHVDAEHRGEVLCRWKPLTGEGFALSERSAQLRGHLEMQQRLCVRIDGVDREHDDNYYNVIVVLVKDSSAPGRPRAIDDIDVEALVSEAWLRTRQRRRRNLAALLAAVVVAAGALIAGLIGTGVVLSGRSAPENPAVVARLLCNGAFGNRALNSSPVSVKEVRTSVPGGPAESPPLRDAFRGASTGAVAAWCWTGKPQNYHLYAVVQGYPPRFFEGVVGPPFTSTPAPGPAAIP